MNTVGGVTPEGQTGAHRYFDQSANAYAAAGLPQAGKKEIAPGGIELWPVLCLNTWEHVWLRDYGIGQGGMGGKVQYAEAWWDAIELGAGQRVRQNRPEADERIMVVRDLTVLACFW